MIEVKDLTVEMGNFSLKEISFKVNRGDFFIIMGPNGAGKTMLIESIAGLVPVKNGKVIIDGEDVTGLPPEKRNISIVYQQPYLFPHIRVIDNIRYGLNFTTTGRNDKKKLLDKYIEVLNLKHLLNRYPSTLSGGEAQRVSLARALVVNPKVLLLDEPVSSVDPGSKHSIKELLLRIKRVTGVTTVMVTHDFSNALYLGNRAIIMNNGMLAQYGTIDAIFSNPATKFVADFIGAKNIFHVKFNGSKALLGEITVETGRVVPRKEGYIAIRPEDISIGLSKIETSMRNSFIGTVSYIQSSGYFFEIGVMVKRFLFKVIITRASFFNLKLKDGERVFIFFKASSINIL